MAKKQDWQTYITALQLNTFIKSNSSDHSNLLSKLDQEK